MWNSIPAAVCAGTGVFLLALAAVGIIRLPDVYMRLSASSKAATLGIGLVTLAAAIEFGSAAAAIRAFLIVGFFILTMPVAAHVIGRAAYLKGTPLWKETRQDDLKGSDP